MPRRPTRLSPDFLAKAQGLFPVERPVSGQPSYADFHSGPLRAALAAFGLDFEAQIAVAGVEAIRSVLTTPSGAFGPLLFTAVLLSDGAVELVSVIDDPDYWDLIADDPLA